MVLLIKVISVTIKNQTCPMFIVSEKKCVSVYSEVFNQFDPLSHWFFLKANVSLYNKVLCQVVLFCNLLAQGKIFWYL